MGLKLPDLFRLIWARWRDPARRAEARVKQLATTLADAATPQWHGTMSRVGMVGMMELMAFRWCLWLGGVHALREASTRKALLWRRAELQRRQQAMQSFRRTGTLSGEGPTRITFRRHVQHGLGAVIDVGAAPRRASAASRRRAQRDVWRTAARRIERVLRVERRGSGRGRASRWVEVRWAGIDPETGQRWADWWLPWRNLSKAVKEEARQLGGWAEGAREMRRATARERAATARARAIGEARRRAAAASDVDAAGHLAWTQSRGGC